MCFLKTWFSCMFGITDTTLIRITNPISITLERFISTSCFIFSFAKKSVKTIIAPTCAILKTFSMAIAFFFLQPTTWHFFFTWIAIKNILSFIYTFATINMRTFSTILAFIWIILTIFLLYFTKCSLKSFFTLTFFHNYFR